MSETNNVSADAETFVSEFSGKTFPASEKIEVKGYGPISQSELDENPTRFCVAADDDEVYLVSVMHKAYDDRMRPTVLVSPDCDWNEDPDGILVNPDHERTVHRRVPGSSTRTREVACHDHDVRAVYCNYAQEHFWEDDFEFHDVHDLGLVAGPSLRDGPFATCDNCGEWFHDDDLDDGLCEACRGSSSSSTSLIQDYGCRSYPDRRGDGPVFLGVELEVETPNDRAAKAEAVSDLCKDERGRFVILKNDGSIDCGFEIVSAPMDLANHQKAWDKLFAAAEARKLTGVKAWTADNCGMHVHVSKAPLSDYQIGKVLVFVNNNDRFVADIAGRRSSYAEFTAGTKITRAKGGFSGRYRAVNLEPSETIEFRIFRSTFNRARFLAHIEFCHAVVQFCAPCAHGATEAASVDAFTRYVRSHRKVYPNLDGLLVRKGYLKAMKTSKAPAVVEPEPAMV